MQSTTHQVENMALQEDSQKESFATPKVKTSSILRSGRRSKLKNTNPTLSSIRDAIGNNSPDMAHKTYRPYLRKKPQTTGKDVFKTATRLITKLHQVIFFATNNSNTLSGEDAKSIQKFKLGRGQDWTLTESIVSIAYRLKNAPEEYDMKFFLTDLPAFLHIFFDTEELKRTMRSVATELSSSWNDTNSTAEMAEKRKENEIPILMDFRKNQYSKNVTELMLAGTTFNHTLSTQNEYKDVECRPEDIVFQLRYQTSEGKCKKGMVALSLEEWERIFDSSEFKTFYQQSWNYLPLPQQYSTRIEEYVDNTEDKKRSETEQDFSEAEEKVEWATEWANHPFPKISSNQFQS